VNDSSRYTSLARVPLSGFIEIQSSGRWKAASEASTSAAGSGTPAKQIDMEELD